MSNTLLKHVTLLVVADKGSQDFLRAAQCTYMATLDPAQIIFVSDFPLPEVGGCGLPVSNRIRVVSAVDYLEVLKTVERSKKVLLPWVLVVKPWTFVHPGHLEAYLEERGSQNPEVYVGRVRNATSELAALSQMPHVAYEYGILMRAWAAVLVGKDKPEFEGFRSNMRHDFHTVRVASAFFLFSFFSRHSRLFAPCVLLRCLLCALISGILDGLNSNMATRSLGGVWHRRHCGNPLRHAGHGSPCGAQ